MSRPTALAIAAHPDDIELKMAGTLLLLKSAGWDIHYFNLSSGNGGSLEHNGEETEVIRSREARDAAAILGATWHPPIARDLEITYHPDLLRKVAAVIRRVRASIVLTHPFEDYMEDHTITARLATTAAFAHGIPNFQTDPPEPAYPDNLAVYHCMPHGGRTRLRRRVAPGAWVDTASVHGIARRALAAHRSQAGWLDASQGTNSYLATMDAHAEEAGQASGKFRLAEGWTRHLHLGFSTVDADPLAEVLGDRYLVNVSFEESLENPAAP
ncbi:PIG-L deacetylase family protein [Luteolibacter sp. Populi]|uniref:PIG-L deacetylase family protein n=1 Tax=Luteolibacter sp. Populi TaxID=3230487 RepID=UPI00346574A9